MLLATGTPGELRERTGAPNVGEHARRDASGAPHVRRHVYRRWPRSSKARRWLSIPSTSSPPFLEGEGELEAVRLTDGRRIEADFAVVGVGVIPRTSLAEAAGLDRRHRSSPSAAR
jgi:hypothetical protein